MQKAIVVTLAASLAAVFATPAVAAQAKREQARSTQPVRSHGECHSLGLQRGLSISWVDRWRMDQFIADCQSGKIR